MPYTSKELKNKPSYKNIIDADKNELKKFFEDEEIKAQQSGSTIEAVRTLRDGDGFVLSYEDPDNLGNTMKSSIQKVRLPMTYPNAVTEELRNKLSKERAFSDFIPRKFWPVEPPQDEYLTDVQIQDNIDVQTKKISEDTSTDKAVKDIAKSTGQTVEQVKESTGNSNSSGKGM